MISSAKPALFNRALRSSRRGRSPLGGRKQFFVPETQDSVDRIGAGVVRLGGDERRRGMAARRAKARPRGSFFRVAKGATVKPEHTVLSSVQEGDVWCVPELNRLTRIRRRQTEPSKKPASSKKPALSKKQRAAAHSERCSARRACRAQGEREEERRENGGLYSLVMPALVAGIHVLRALRQRKSWMDGTSPAMTGCRFSLSL